MVTGAIEAPKRLEDLHVRRDLVASLLLRTLAFADQLTGATLEQRLGLPFETFSPLIDEFEKNQLMDTRGVSNDPGLEGRPYPVKMNYAISGAGRQRAAEMSAVQTRYLGPCPVNFEDYLALIRSQVSGKSPVTDAQLKKALGELELEQHIIDQIGGAMVSRASLFIFGAPGNGKSTITERMALLMGAPIEIPHAVALGDEIVRKIELPFLCQVVFSTNLSPTELVDEAFLRRMAYKIGIGNPTPEAFGRILRFECDRQGVPFDEKAIGYLLNNLYGKKPLRGSHPRALVARLVDLANYRQQPPRLTPQSLKEAFDACFNPALGSLVEDDWARPAIG